MTEPVRSNLIQKIAGACQEWRSSNESFARIQQGTEFWNTWRKENPQVRPDLSGLDLANLDLQGIDFSRAKLTRTDLTGANLTEASFIGADLGQCILNAATLVRADFKDADLIWAKLVEADVNHANLTRAKCIECEGIGSKLHGANLRDAKLSRSSFMDADFSGASLVHVKALETNFNDAKLCQVNMTGAVAIGADFWQVDFSGSTLTRADLSRSNFSHARLVDADLTGVNLEDTQLPEVVFDQVKLTGACVYNWRLDEGTNLDNIQCDYVYLGTGFQGRYPHGKTTFKPGQFAAALREGAETIELMFEDGINWLAFLQVLRSITEEHRKMEAQLRAFEQQEDGALIIRLEVRSALSPGEVEALLITNYQKALASVDEHYQSDLGWSEEHVVHYQNHCADLMEIARIVASYRPSSNRKRQWMTQATLSESA